MNIFHISQTNWNIIEDNINYFKRYALLSVVVVESELPFVELELLVDEFVTEEHDIHLLAVLLQ
jgi:hypothetical protein